MRTKGIIIIVLIIIFVLAFFCFNPIVIINWDFENRNITKQEKFFKNFDFKQGKWKCYLVNIDNDVSPLVSNGKVLETSDTSILIQLQNVNFLYPRSDMATIESLIYLYKDNELIFCTSIWLGENRAGMQTSEFGWIEAKNPQYFCELFGYFKRSYKPIYIF